jgi:hypothetical protein
MPSRLEDPAQKVSFYDQHWVKIEGGRAAFEVGPNAVYLVIGLRNAGSGIAVLHGWHFSPERLSGTDPPDSKEFRRLTRDIYVPAGDTGFWQGAFRDPNEPLYAVARDAATTAKPVTIDLLYGDHEGGQRMISRFGLSPTPGGTWLAVVARHWNLDRPTLAESRPNHAAAHCLPATSMCRGRPAAYGHDRHRRRRSRLYRQGALAVREDDAAVAA